MRAITVGLLVIVISVLAGLVCWASEHDRPLEFPRAFYATMVVMQGAMFILWTLSECGQAISRERELKTYDFLKTTRLTSAELLVGKLLGAPVLAYFALACSLPISVVAGLMAGLRPTAILWTYLLMLVVGLFWSLVGLFLSMTTEKTGVNPAVLGLVLIFPIMGMAMLFLETAFPGLAAISVAPAVQELYGEAVRAAPSPSFFGLRVSYQFLSVFLHATFGAWIVLMLIRNLKKDLEQIRLLSRWGAVGFVIFLNVLLYALLDPKRIRSGAFPGMITEGEISTIAVILNAVIIFAVGVATLTPAEKLKVWWRRSAAAGASWFAGDAPPWPWLLVAAMSAYFLLAVEAAALSGIISFRQWPLGSAAVQLLTFLIFSVRDVLFLQWCLLTRMKRQVLKGFLFLCLYYTAALIVGAVVQRVSEPAGRLAITLLTPFLVFDMHANRLGLWGELVGMALQIGMILFMLRAIVGRLERPAGAAAAAAA
jgi:hypothetical protein